MLIVRGVNVFPSQIEAVISELPEFSPHYQIVVSKQQTMDSVDVQVELNEKIYPGLTKETSDENDATIFQTLRHKLAKKIKDSIGLSMNVTIRNQNSVPRSEGGKLNRVVDHRKM
jgi:phenylacetate-CoA ligase